jgi:hypothetical protein
LILTTPCAQAATIYSQTPVIENGVFSDAGPSDNDGGHATQYAADNFTAGISDAAVSVLWRGTYAGDDNTPAPTDSFTINFYFDAGGSVGSLISSFAIGNTSSRTLVGIVPSFGLDIFEYTADLGAGISLVAGTDYWLSIFNDTTSDPQDNWAWDGCGPSSCTDGVLASKDLISWVSSGTVSVPIKDAYFEVSSATVPIPAAFWLFGSALGLLGWMRRKAG